MFFFLGGGGEKKKKLGKGLTAVAQQKRTLGRSQPPSIFTIKTRLEKEEEKKGGFVSPISFHMLVTPAGGGGFLFFSTAYDLHHFFPFTLHTEI